MTRRRRQGRGLLVGTLIMALLGFGVHRSLIALQSLPRTALPQTVLVVGTAPAQGPSGVVTVATVLLLVHQSQGQVEVLIIPANTRVSLGAYGPQEIGRAYTFGGPSLLAREVAVLVGITPPPTAVLPSVALAGEVSQLGGVTVGGRTLSGSEVMISWQAAAGSGAPAAEAATDALLPKLAAPGQWLKAPLFAETLWANSTGSLPWSTLIAEARVWGQATSPLTAVLPGAVLRFQAGDQWLVLGADAARAWRALVAGQVPPVQDSRAKAAATTLEQGK